MKYLSVCSGIEAASAAWHHLGWTPVAFSEVDKFPSAVLKHHYPNVPNWGDMTKFKEWPDAAIDVLVGGTPCQSFSVAGLRKGMADPRGNLALTYLAIADRYKPRFLIWENVPGVLSSNEGRDFGSILGGMGELGYGVAYRVLDAQFFGVPQRRRRIFVVGHLGDWRRAAAVLFERESLLGHPPPSREARQGIAPTVTSGAANGGASHGARSGSAKENLIVPVAPTLVANGNRTGGTRPPGTDGDTVTSLIPVIMSSGQANAEILTDGGAPSLTCLHEAPIVAVDYTNLSLSEDVVGTLEAAQSKGNRGHGVLATAFKASHFTRGKDGAPSDVVPPLKAQSGQTGKGDAAPLVAFSIMPMNSGKDYKARETDVAQPIMAGGPVGGNQGGDFIKSSMQVRRLTPRECERLQGFPDDFTLIPWRGGMSPDGPRYKALGNSMAVPVMAWIGKRIQMVEDMT